MQDLPTWLGLDSGPFPTLEEVATWLPNLRRRPRRLLVLSDIHANWHALVAVLEHAQGRYDTIWFLGDIAGYGPWPIECVCFLKRISPQRWRVGNHDLGMLDRGKGVADGYRPSRMARWTWERHSNQLKEEAPDLWHWLQRTVTVARTEAVQRRYGILVEVFVHANLSDKVGHYLYPDDRFNLFENLLEVENRAGPHNPGACLIAGHTHMVCLARLEVGSPGVDLLPIVYGESISIRAGRYFINPGSVGQPRDGDRRAAYAILDASNGTVEYHRVEYDVVAVQREMQKKGYPDELAERLWTAQIDDTTHFDSVYLASQDGVIPRGAEHEPVESARS